MTTLENDLQNWSRTWQTEEIAEPIPDLRSHVEHETRMARWGMLAPVIVTIVIGGAIGMRAAQTGEPADVSQAAGVWLFIVFTWMGSLWLARGTWSARDETTTAFIDVSISRCESWLHAAPFSLVLYVGELAFQVLWSTRFTDRSLWESLTTWPMVVLGWLGLPAFILALLGVVRRKRAQRDYLRSLQRQFAEA
ncbi:MAG: hypothetical protein ABI859_04020 [Pseudomonadota bacterium]